MIFGLCHVYMLGYRVSNQNSAWLVSEAFPALSYYTFCSVSELKLIICSKM